MADDDFRAFIAQLQSVVTSPMGRQLVAYLRTRFMDRRTIVTEALPNGRQVARLARVSSFSTDVAEMARMAGQADVVLFLEDLQESEFANEPL